MPKTDPNARLDWVDAAKGFAILCVVLGHALRGLEPTGLLEPRTFAAFDARIYAFHMPLFFMLSGFFFLEGSSASLVVRLRRSTLGLLVPLVMWTYLFLLARGAAGDMTNAGEGLGGVLTLPVPGMLQFWFLWALWQIHVGVLLVTAPFRGGRIPTSALAALAMASAALAAIPMPAPVHHWIGQAVTYLPFFLAGGLLWRGVAAPAPAPAPWVRLACAAAFAAMLMAVAGPGRGSVPADALALLLASLAVVALSGGVGGPAGRALVWMGTSSLSIYLMHTFFSAGLRIALIEAGLGDAATIVLLTTAIGVAGPILLTLALRGRPASRWLGLHRQRLPARD